MPEKLDVKLMNLRGIDEVGFIPLNEDCSGYDGTVKKLLSSAVLTMEWTQVITDVAVGRDPSYGETKSYLLGKGTLTFESVTRVEIIELFDCNLLDSGGVSFGDIFSKRKWFGVYVKQSNSEVVAKLDMLKTRFLGMPKFEAKSISKDNADNVVVECPIECFPVNELLANGTYKPHSYIMYDSVNDSAKWARIKDTVVFPNSVDVV